MVTNVSTTNEGSKIYLVASGEKHVIWVWYWYSQIRFKIDLIGEVILSRIV